MLSSKTKRRLINALTRKGLADELENALQAAKPLSIKLKRAVEVALASKKAALELIKAVETPGSQTLSADTKRRIIVEMASKDAGLEIISKAEADNTGAPLAPPAPTPIIGTVVLNDPAVLASYPEGSTCVTWSFTLPSGNFTFPVHIKSPDGAVNHLNFVKNILGISTSGYSAQFNLATAPVYPDPRTITGYDSSSSTDSNLVVNIVNDNSDGTEIPPWLVAITEVTAFY